MSLSVKDFLSRTSLEHYKRLVRDKCLDDYRVQVELNEEEIAVILQIYDHGVNGMTAEEQQLFHAVITKLKDQI